MSLDSRHVSLDSRLGTLDSRLSTITQTQLNVATLFGNIGRPFVFLMDRPDNCHSRTGGVNET